MSMKWMTLVLAVAFACGGGSKEAEKEKEKQKEKEKEGGGFGSLVDKAKELGGGAADKAKELGGGAADKAKEMGGQAVDKAKEVGGQAVDKAKSIDFEGKAKELGDEAARRAAGLGKDAVALGKQLKDKVFELSKKKLDYDISLEAVEESKGDTEKKVRGMKQLKVGDYAVGYKQFSTHPLGKVYNWQFQITWPLVTGKAVRMSLYTNEELQELALAAMLGDIVPAATLLLK